MPTLDQLAIFLAVADAGSFGGAARALRRAVSAISYGIAQLEAQLELVLFDRAASGSGFGVILLLLVLLACASR